VYQTSFGCGLFHERDENVLLIRVYFDVGIVDAGAFYMRGKKNLIIKTDGERMFY
jgi:hypothetical protein